MKNLINAIPTVYVLMSTYNGEKYIQEQIDSILLQQGVSVELYIRDDGSSDNTKKIIEENCFKYNNVHYLVDDKNLGPGMSFMCLLYEVARSSSADYFAFADQDDVWDEQKLLVAISKMCIMDRLEDVAILYCSNQKLFIKGSIEHMRFSKVPNLDLAGHITKNLLSGCTFVMNMTLVNKITEYDIPGRDIIDYRLHDAWIFLIAIVCGTIIYDEDSYINYRIHENNVVGIKKKTLWDKIHRVFNKSTNRVEYKNLRMKTAQLLLDRYSSIMKGEDKELLSAVALYQKSIKHKLVLLKKKEIYQKSGERKLVFILKVLMNYL